MGWVDEFIGLLACLENTFKALDVFFQEVIEEHLDPNKQKETDGEYNLKTDYKLK